MKDEIDKDSPLIRARVGIWQQQTTDEDDRETVHKS
jgi:hypothetical protein